MRVDKLEKGSIVHVIQRGGRGLNIVKDISDRKRFIRSLFFLNHVYFNPDWDRLVSNKAFFTSNPTSSSRTAGGSAGRAGTRKRDSLTAILAFTLLTNHFHLILMETREGGVASFMKRLGQSMTNHFNQKYSSRGSIFQGGYKGKRIDNDRYLRWVVPYVLVKNTFEMHPRGLLWASKNFEEAWKWAISYPFSSLRAYAGEGIPSAINPYPLRDALGGPKQFKSLCKEMIHGRMGNESMDPDFMKLTFDHV